MAIAYNTSVSIVNATSRAGEQTNAKVAALSNGNFVVAWESLIAADTTLSNVRFQIFNASGAPAGSVTNVSALPANNEKLQDITGNADGSFTVAYLSTGAIAPGSAPGGYGAIGSFTQIGVVRNFSNAGVAQGIEVPIFTVAGPGANEEIVNSLVLQSETSSSNVVYFTQRDQATLNGGLYKSAAISTNPPGPAGGPAASTFLKGYAAPASEILVLDSARQSATSDLLSLTGRYLFSDGAASEAVLGGVSSVETVAPNLLLAMRGATSTSGVSGSGAQGAGNQAGLYASAGSITSFISGVGLNAGNTFAPKIEALGNGRFFVAFAFDESGFNVADGIYATVFNANTLEFEHQPVRVLETGATQFDLAVLANGRVAITTHSQSAGLGGNDVTMRIVDASDSSFTTRTGFSSFNSVHAASFANDALGVRVDLENSSQNTGAAAAFNFSVLGGIAHVIGGTNADTIAGNSDSNILKGLNGADVLFGRSGEDQLFGGDGDDIADGGANDDLVDGGIGNDTLRGGTGNDTVFGRLGADKLNGDDGNDTLNGNENADSVHGGAGNDIVNGGADNDVLSGGLGTDFVDGGAGNDTILAGQGSDTINGNLGIDTVNYLHFAPAAGTNAGVFVDLGGVDDFDGLGVAGLGATPTEPSDTLINIENVFGNIGNDILIGSAVNNRLGGGAGNDLIFGRGGADALSGDAGVDFFRYDAPAEGGDTIFSFDQGADKLLFLSAAFGDTSNTNIGTRFLKNTTGLASAAGPQFILNTSTGQMNYDADGTGAGAANPIALIKFTTGSALNFSGSDFLFF